MKKIAALIMILSGAAAMAQVRSSGDIDTKAFVIGLDQSAAAGSNLDFTVGGETATISVSATEVSVGSATLFNTTDTPADALMAGIHDFTGDSRPEIVVGYRAGNVVGAEIWTLRQGEWTKIGSMNSSGSSECRIFRQALTIKNPSNGALYSWTWHKDRFDFKASDGSSDPTK